MFIQTSVKTCVLIFDQKKHLGAATGLMAFPKALAQSETQTSSYRI